MTVRLRRIESLLGSRLDELDFATVAALVGNTAAAETDDLDHKGEHHTTDEKGRAELAKDVAALANTVGGVLIIGMHEHQRVPSRVNPVDLADAAQGRIRETIASRVFPLPRYELYPLPESPGARKGILIVAVSRSIEAPHLVIRDAKAIYGYPARNGDRTRLLSESEIATAYRRRFTELASRGERIDAVEADALRAAARLQRPDPIVAVTLVPDVPGTLSLDNDTRTRLRARATEDRPLPGLDASLFRDFRIGARRVVVASGSEQPEYRAELHMDGSGAWTHAATRREHHPHTGMLNPPGGVDVDAVVHTVVAALHHLARHADTTGTSGTARIRVTLRTRANTELMGSPGATYLMTASPGHPGRWHTTGEEAHPTATGEAYALVEDLADGGPLLAGAAWMLLCDLFQHYGLAEPDHLTRDGAVRLPAWHAARSRAEAWSRAAGLDEVDW